MTHASCFPSPATWGSRSGLAKDEAWPHVTLGEGPYGCLPYFPSGGGPICAVSLKPSTDAPVPRHLGIHEVQGRTLNSPCFQRLLGVETLWSSCPWSSGHLHSY